jgi:uncharacterized protein|tara:strand:- start:93 stop:839 length:747 start_codon:yes stop_codon:yes gene_type:complete
LEIYILVLLFFTGLFAGVLNAVAGGATFFTFPALMLAGLSPLSANATNFIATAPGNIAALPAFWDELKIIGKKIFAPLIISAIGGLLGAVVLFSLGANIFKNLVPYLMGFATILFLAAPRLRKIVLNTNLKSKIVPLVLLLSFAVYGGYFGAGLGQIALAVLILIGFENLHKANAMKNAVIASISLPASIIYIYSGEVFWPYALVMAVGAAIGGFTGGKISKSIPQIYLRFFIIGLGTLLTIYYFIII